MRRLILTTALIAATVATVFSATACGTTTTTETTAPMTAGTTGGAADKTPDPTTPEVAIVSIFSVNDSGSGLKQGMDSIDSLDANLLMSKLIEYNVVDKDTVIENFTNNNGDAVLNLKALSKKDKQTIAAISNTFISNFSLNKLTIQVEGKDVSGGKDLAYVKDYRNYNPDGNASTGSAAAESKATVIKKESLSSTKPNTETTAKQEPPTQQ